MKIGFLGPDLLDAERELVRVADAQARELRRRGHELFLDDEAERGDGVEVVHVFHGTGFDPGRLERLARRSAVVLFLHGDAGAGLGRDLPGVDRVVVPSRLHLVRLADVVDFAPRQVRLLEPGLDLELPAERRRPRAWRGRGPLRILVLGGRRDGPGLVALARAAGEVGAEHVELVVPGPGDPHLDPLLVALARPGGIELLGEPDAAGLARIAADCHLAAFPSTRPESYALPVDVAVALGLPVWASSAEAALERYGAGALELLPPGDPEAWASALREWLADPRLARDAFRALPDAVPTAAESAATLERWDQELLTETRARLRRPIPPAPRDGRRPA